MSLKRNRSALAQEATDSDHFNAQVRAADERARAATDSPAPSPSAGNMRAPSAFASSPASTPIKIPARKERRSDSPARPESPDELQEPDSSPASTTALLGTSPERSVKRTRLGYGRLEDTETDSSPTPAGPRVSTDSTSTRMTLIGAGQLTKLREDKEKLLEANKGLAKEAAKLKKKATKDEKLSDENDVLTMENKRLERAIEKENQENVELQLQLGQLRQERDQFKETCDEWAVKEAEWKGLVEAGNAAVAKHHTLQQDHQRLQDAFFSLNSRILGGEVTVATPTPAPAPAPARSELSSSPGIDLARGFERYGHEGRE